ncbi:MAG: bifunctional 5,10-methylenetetrahydrofolate dehydrogenase/5,10-methenyltetrahydrofolate cyclohydrolase [bacterium]|nr:bifunctional 5,10-methylenetetrahydrofolate dehydrogenase/5,10-methenyltetrahydrofolate cyclohydrolase [bacterium]
MKILNGAELRDFIKERQAKQVRALRQSWRVVPKLVIFYASESPVTGTYMRLKENYGADILIEVERRKVELSKMQEAIRKANFEKDVHGIIVQLPLENEQNQRISVAETEEILAEIAPEKDVDGLNAGDYDSATAQAINWLLAGYNVELKGKQIAIVGQGKLVGAPLAKMWENSGFQVAKFDETNAEEMQKTLSSFDIVITAVGKPGLIDSRMLKPKAVVVDAGTASEKGEIRGDVAEEVRLTRDDLTITPKKGGVGPLTVAALFDNVIQAARKIANQKGQQDL